MRSPSKVGRKVKLDVGHGVKVGEEVGAKVVVGLGVEDGSDVGLREGLRCGEPMPPT